MHNFEQTKRNKVMYTPNDLPNSRIEVADILRGIAIGGIVILHTLEHSGFYIFPEQAAFNQRVWDATFFLLSNKMYAIFALLFGLSFFVQHDNQAQKGKDFRLRYAWRMVLLFIIGIVNCAIYNGDILMIYAIGGILLIPLIRLDNKILAAISFILFLQPIEWGYLICAIFDPDTHPLFLSAWKHYAAVNPAMESGTFWETCKASLQHGFLANVYSALENGRLTQTFFLFVLGILVGRKRLFYNENSNLKFWKKALIIAAIAFVPLCAAFYLLPEHISNETIKNSVHIILNMWKNFSMVVLIVAGIVLLYYNSRMSKALQKIAPYGKMSLTNYTGASVIGGFLFFNWGFAQCRYLNHTWSVLLGIVIVLLQWLFSRWWMSRHQRGPLEGLWRKATWIDRRS